MRRRRVAIVERAIFVGETIFHTISMLPLISGYSHSRLTVLPIWLALFDQRTQAFLGIFQFIKLVEKDVHGSFQAVAHAHAHAGDDSLLGHPQNSARLRGDYANHP